MSLCTNNSTSDQEKKKVTKLIERWTNVYTDGIGFTYLSENGANADAGVDRIACVKLTGTYEVEE